MEGRCDGQKKTITIQLQSGQVKSTLQDFINKFIIPGLNQLVVIDFSFISALLHT